MSKISLQPHDAPEILVYKYFHDKLNAVLTYKGSPVPFKFEHDTTTTVYPHARLEFVRHIVSKNLRYIGDDIVIKNLDTQMFEKVSIGEPFEAIWVLAVEAKTRDAVYNLLQQIRVKLGRTGCIREPQYIEHTRADRYDHFGTNALYKGESEETRFVGKLGLRVYMRMAGGIPDPTYEPRPQIEEISLSTRNLDTSVK